MPEPTVLALAVILLQGAAVLLCLRFVKCFGAFPKAKL